MSQYTGIMTLTWKSQFGNGNRGRGEESGALCFAFWFCASYSLGYALKDF